MTRFDFFGLGLLLASVLFCIFGFKQLQSNTEDVLQWLPDNSEARQQYNDFAQKFGSDDFLIVTWDDCTIDDPRLKEFCQRLKDNDSNGLIQSVLSGADIIDRLESKIELSKKAIIHRFQGIYFGIKDSNQTLALVELSKKGSANRKESLQQIDQVVVGVPGLEVG